MAFKIDFPISFLKQYHLSDAINYKSDTFDIIYVISGKISVSTEESYTTIYNSNDIFVLYSDHMYALKADKDNIIIHFGLNPNFMHECRLTDSNIICDSVREPNRNYTQLRNIIFTITSLYLDDAESHELSLLSAIYQLMSLLQKEHYISSGAPDYSSNGKYQERINQISNFIHDNYRYSITLNQLAKYMYLTPQYLSKFFKKNFDTNFNQYLNTYRVEHALHDLLYTNKKVTDIAISHGFPNVSTFNRHFKDRYGKSPREYRKDPTIQPPTTAVWLKENNEYHSSIMTNYENSQNIEVSVKSAQNFLHNFTDLINVGYAKNLTNDAFLDRLLSASEELNFKYIRLEGLISNSMLPKISKSDEYYFYNVDKILNFLYQNNMIPFIELGKNSYDYLNTNTISPNEKSYLGRKRYKEMLYAFLQHAIDYFRADWVNTWIFEIWKLPNETNEDYATNFKYIQSTIKEIIPYAKCGGFGHNTSISSQKLIKTFDTFIKEQIEPDFLSFHVFGLQPDLTNSSIINPTVSTRNLVLQQQWINNQILSHWGHKIPVYITEFNSSIIPQTYISESCFQAAYITKNLLSTHLETDMIGYWMLDDNTFSSRNLGPYIENGISLITKSGIPTPAYHAYRFLNKLGNQLIDESDNYCITKSDEGEFEVIAFNYAHFANIESVIHNLRHSILDLYSYFEDVPDITFNFTLKDLEPGTYRIKRYLLDRAHGSLIDIYLGGIRESKIPEESFMYKMQTPFKNDLHYLKSNCIPEERNIFIVSDSELEINITLSAHNVCLFEIRKEL